MAPDGQLVTNLLQEWAGGNKQALDRLMPLVYDQLRRLAACCLASERFGHTLRATALVNEAYLRLVDCDISCHDRAHFYAFSARLLRHILVDYARAQQRQKRGAGADALCFDDAVPVGSATPAALLELHDALAHLAAQDFRKSEIVELVFFGGLTYEEAALALNISPATVHRELRMAKAWLRRELAAQ